MPLKDKKKRKAYQKKYKEINKEQISIYQKEYTKKWRDNNPKAYSYVSTSNTEWVIKRRELSRENFKQWQVEKRRKYARELYCKNKQIIDKYKESHPCSCGENNITCLEFHHRDESTKEFSISEGKGRSTSMVQKEMDKCNVLCKNCHTKLHNKDITNIDYNKLIDELNITLATKLNKLERRGIYGKKQKTISKIYVRDYKIEHNCKKCEEKDPNCLVFHHRKFYLYCFPRRSSIG